MLNVVVYGNGNVAKMAMEAIRHSGDMSLAGVVYPKFAGQTLADGVKIVKDVDELPACDVAVLALPTRLVPDTAARLLEKGIHTTDSYDIHGDIPAIRSRLSEIAIAGGACSILSAGWDPGADSVVRALLEAMAPQGITYTNFGPGMSMGHSVAARAVPGVKDALSMTIPLGTGVHRRMVYVQLAEGHTLQDVTARIKADDYFSHDETLVFAVDNVGELRDMGHGVHMTRKGVSSGVHNQLFTFEMCCNNPALTAQVMVCAARAAARQKPGCYTMIEIPPVDFLCVDKDEAVRRLV